MRLPMTSIQSLCRRRQHRDPRHNEPRSLTSMLLPTAIRRTRRPTAILGRGPRKLRPVGHFDHLRPEFEPGLGEAAGQLGVLRGGAARIGAPRLPRGRVFPADVRQPNRHGQPGHHASRLQPRSVSLFRQTLDLGSVSGSQLCGLADINPAKAGLTSHQVITFANNYSGRREPDVRWLRPQRKRTAHRAIFPPGRAQHRADHQQLHVEY